MQTYNKQQFLRLWAQTNAASEEELLLSPEEVRKLSECIIDALSALDSFWETVSGRKLTDAEKFGEK